MASSKKLKVDSTGSDLVSKRIINIFNSFGISDYQIGEPITIAHHCCQAGHLATQLYPDDKEFIAACLLHDIGHMVGLEANQPLAMEGCGIVDHEALGAEFLLKLGFSSRIANLVCNHVSAKRYRCYADPSYYDKLTSASKTTLKYQGGPMTKDEADAFEKSPDFEKFIKMRAIDEDAKVVDKDAPPIESYAAFLDSLACPSASLLGYTLSASQIDFWKKYGYLKVSNLLSNERVSVADIRKWVEEISSWPKAEGKWLQHWELSTADGASKILCRSENFVDYHPEVKTLCCGFVQDVVSQLFEEPAVLFKEKINYKLPGGAGFAAHQDSPAYIGLADDHISVMIAVDDSNLANGCLQVAGGVYAKDQVKLTPSGILLQEEEERLHFEHVECVAGDILFFGGYTPHRSDGNTSQSSRRAIFLTYNPLSQGDHHEAYYAAKHKGANGFNAGHTISFQGDFQGTIVM